MEKRKVVILMTDDNKGYWSIYDESGGAIEHDFESEDEAYQFADDNDMEPVNTFNVRDKEPKKEWRVYVVSIDEFDMETEVAYPGADGFDEEKFIMYSEEEGRVYTLQGFQEAFNAENISDTCDFILFKEVIVHE